MCALLGACTKMTSVTRSISLPPNGSTEVVVHGPDLYDECGV